MHIDFGERVIPYELADLNELTLVYAITIHRAQGSEYLNIQSWLRPFTPSISLC